MEEEPSECSESLGLEKYGQVLSSNFPIVEAIFENFKLKDLLRVSKVCKFWKEVASMILEKRTGISWMFFISAYRAADKHLMPALEKPSCSTKTSTFKVESHYWEALYNAPAKPQLIIIFSTRSVYGQPPRYYLTMARPRLEERLVFLRCEGQKGRAKKKLIHEIKDRMPPFSETVAICSSGIIGTPSNSFLGYEAESSQGLTALFLPKNQAMEYRLITFPNEKDFSTLINPEKPVKCLLVFTLHKINEKEFSRFLNYVMEKNNYEVALAGIVVNKFELTNDYPEKSIYESLAIAISGDQVQAASLLLTKEVNNENEVIKKLQEFKNQLGFSTDKDCIAFQFSCCGRGQRLYKNSNIEVSSFNKVFPKVPVTGMFGYGEYGMSYTPLKKACPKVVNCKSMKKFSKEFAVVYVILYIPNSM